MNGGGGGTIRVTVAQMQMDCPSGRTIGNGQGFPTVTNFGAGPPFHFPLEGVSEGQSSGTQATWRTFALWESRVSNYFVKVRTNGLTNSCTFALHVNGVDTALGVSISAGATGNFEDTTDTVDITGVFSDVYNHRIDGTTEAASLAFGPSGFLHSEIVPAPATGRAFFFWF